MPVERVIGYVLLLGLLTIGLCTVVNTTLAILARRRRKDRSGEAERMDARLSRIEAAVEAIAIEVERQGELQRVAARIDPHRLPDPRLVERPVTSH